MPDECEDWGDHVFVNSVASGSICEKCGRAEHGCGCWGCRKLRLVDLRVHGLVLDMESALDELPL